MGFAVVLPGSTSNLSNPLAGVPLGYGDSRSGLNDNDDDDDDNNNLRELPALPSSWRCAREGRVGTGGRVIAKSPNVAVGEIGSNHIGLCAGGHSKIAPASGE